MSSNIFLWLVCIILIHLALRSRAKSCILKNDGDCRYTVLCYTPMQISNPSCNKEINITFILTKTNVDPLTKSYFATTNFDSAVTSIISLNNTWKVIGSHAFQYYSKILSMYLSNSNIYNIESEAFFGLPLVQNINLSHNFLSTLSTNAFLMSENKNSDLTILDLSYNTLTNLTVDVFKPVTKLKNLYLNNNLIHTLSTDSFLSTKSLLKLHLQHNYIKSFNLSLIRLHDLETLDASNNFLEKISAFEMNRLISLKLVNVSYNKLETVESNSFDRSLNLETIDLRNNIINMSIDRVMFKNNVILKHLNLYNNSIYGIQEDSFKYNTLEYLNLERNKLRGELKSNIFSGLGNVTTLNLYGQYIKKINNGAFSNMSMLTNLNISKNQITDIENSSFVGANSLKILDLSKNFISTICFFTDSMTNLTEIYLNGNQLKIVQSNAFICQKSLITLELSDNQIVTIEPFSLPLNKLQYLKLNGNRLNGTLKKNVISPAKYLRTLNLSGHEINKIENEAIVDMPVLASLNMSNNKIASIGPNNFQGLKNLYNLDFSSNNITEIIFNNSDLFHLNGLHLNRNKLSGYCSLSKNMSNLIYLDLSYNEISNMSLVTFESALNIQDLMLSHNQITTFKSDLPNLLSLGLSSNRLNNLNLTTYKSLIVLDISYNAINYINNSFFHNLDKLNYLDISGNNISVIEPGTFKNLYELKFLNASSNRLQRLRYGAFKGINKTNLIDISKNMIKDLDIDVFHECNELKTLVIDYNFIQNIDVERLIEISPKLAKLSLGGNPISCKEIIRNINKFNIEVTSIDKVYHDDNIYGIQCGDINNSVTRMDNANVKPTIFTPSDGNYGNFIWSTVITVLIIVLFAILFLIYRKLNIFHINRLSSLPLTNSLEMNGTEFD